MPAENFALEPPSDADRRWYRIVRRVAAFHERIAQTQQAYIQQCLQREASGQSAILPTPDELAIMLMNTDDRIRNFVAESLALIVEYRNVLDNAVNQLASLNGDIDRLIDGENDEEEGSRGFQFTASQVADFVQTLAQVEINTLQMDEAKCSICKLEYGTRRGDTTSSEPASNSDQELQGEDAPEQPVKLSCGHLFGEWCMKTWLLEQPASCPTCRLQFEPISQ